MSDRSGLERPALNDPGLSAPRTALAWQRTALTLLALAAFALRTSGTTGGPATGALIVIAAGLGLLAIVHFEIGQRRHTWHRSGRLFLALPLAVVALASGHLASLLA